jgi:hypothetical protein
MRWLIAAVAVLVAVVVGTQFGWKFVFAPLLGYGFIRWSLGSLRAMTQDSRAVAHREEPQPVVVDQDERTWYWCEDCGTELLEVVRGTGKAPRHCAQSMHERAEVPRLDGSAGA